ncbi:MAG: hypothetical protein IPN53_03925 [Comamonadaceae bacterium]|nr:hypothetical protein [Comamonadaceae bacterium]
MTDETPKFAAFFCQRDDAGSITAVTHEALSADQVTAGHWHTVSADSDEVRQFLVEDTDHVSLLSQTDVGLARVLEDLIDVLITRGLIQFTDLPQAAQAKLLERRQSRASLSHRLELMPLDGENGLI